MDINLNYSYRHAAKECPPLAMAIALEIKNGTFKEDSNIIEFSVVDVAAAIGWNSGVVKYQLKNLEWIQSKILLFHKFIYC